MAGRLIWSPDALADVAAIGAFIEADSPAHARRVVQKIVDSVESVLDHPRLGRVVPEFDDPDLRERFVYSYRIIYSIDGGDVSVIAVVHGRRLLENL